MLRFTFFIIYFCISTVYSLVAQQNFINVPSSEVTKKNKLFYQQQININEQIQFNSTLDFGLGSGFEVGMNILGLNYDKKIKTFIKNDTSDIDPYNPLLMINGLKSFEITDNLAIAVGAQYGLNFRDNKKTREAGLLYVNGTYKNFLIKNSTTVAGVYYNSLRYGGKGNRVGVWLGTEMPIHEKIHIMTESVLGYNSLSYTSIGVILYPLKKMPITLGMQIPNSKQNSYSFVFEITFTPN